MSSETKGADTLLTRHRTAVVKGREIFYREGGDPNSQTILLLHALPSSSREFRALIHELSDRFHLIAPDYIGFGHSEAPSWKEFVYTFDALAEHVTDLLDVLGVRSYVLYVHGIGGPIGFRLFEQNPERVKGFIIQNVDGYAEGIGRPAKDALFPLWQCRDFESEDLVREFLSPEGTKYQWLAGTRDPEHIDPDNWLVDQHLLDRPDALGNQIDLLADYVSNFTARNRWHEAFRNHKPRTLILWGKNDPFYLPAAAEAFLRDLPDAKLIWLDAGHFVLDECVDEVANNIRIAFNYNNQADLDDCATTARSL
jgi:pimeloyl-ACP methyl ester carboxylesterase